MKSVSVYAPASMGNVSVGFDLLGAALEPLYVEQPFGDVVTVTAGQGISLECRGDYAHFLPKQGNIVERCAERFIERHAPQCQGLALTLEKNLPIGSGLGSSASSVVAALAALNRYFDDPLEPQQLLQFMGELEGEISGSVHFDNVAPSYLGGMQLMLADDAQPLPCFDNWYWLVAYPGITLSTAKMRALLPSDVPMTTTIGFGQQLATFVAACYRQDEQQALAVLNDVLAEPHRAAHIPGYQAAKLQLQQLGFEAVGISGSGPTLFAVCRDEQLAKQGADYLQTHYVTNQYGLVRVCRLARQGVQYMEHQLNAVN
ncbi:homoserine kinase [Ferrimonas lipolytica]|uniref:Homoserine kinase n=1 Tax=Ferrimonas lipolytica TaxID=2724191 RepID=A0A6H1UG21_9GAMM|nr:homoserine kinase [Ferrimonas lipolytica]QIZ77550.1 homoserine kinase [Ferrimonas lipolytica]